jgi:hypothetical protein
MIVRPAVSMPGIATVRHWAGFGPTLWAAVMASIVAVAALQFPSEAEWTSTWHDALDLGASLWLVVFVALWPALRLGQGAVEWTRYSRLLPADTEGGPTITDGVQPATTMISGVSQGKRGQWAAVLLAICLVETLLHGGERNPFVATSRPESGVMDWTSADGYAIVLDGHIAQGDGLFLLPLLNLFLGDRPPSPSEFDRRAGHLFLVSLLARPLGAYWAFTAINLLSWWAAALAVWQLGRRRWPVNWVPEIAALLTATGQGFIFMATAPQAHAPAFAAFALVLVLADSVGVWRRDSGVGGWLRVGWAAGAAGLIYLVYLPCALFFWLYGAGRTRLVGLIGSSVLILAIVFGWERYAAALAGLSFSGGNNDLAGEAVRGWITLAQKSPAHLVSQLHTSSPRGLVVAAFYYPLLLLATIGFAVSTPDARRWAMAVLVAGALPAVAFTTRFTLPRVAYFMYPAMYVLAAAGIVWLAGRLPAHHVWLRRGAMVALAGGLMLLTNADVVGMDQLTLWFHHSQGNTW